MHFLEIIMKIRNEKIKTAIIKYNLDYFVRKFVNFFVFKKIEVEN
jgi:hypothetical protein